MKITKQLLKDYYYLTKPGIIRGNALMAAAGYLFAGYDHFSISSFLALLIGTSGVVAAACVCNNFIDRDIDAKMARTKKRALVQGTITPAHALTYATLLGGGGFVLLALWTNWLTVILGAIGFVSYVGLYTFYKRLSVHGTLVGSISGAVPPMAGYAAATGHLGVAGWLLGLILVCWQMPHFYAIALFRQADYAAAEVPVLPVKKGFRRTRTEIMIYVLLFALAVGSLHLLHYTKWIFFVTMSGFSLIWLIQGVRPSRDSVKWGRRMFGWSLLVLLSLIVLLAANPLLPF